MVPTLATHLKVVSHSNQLTPISRILPPPSNHLGYWENFPANFSIDYSISGRQPHHQVRGDLIYPPGGTSTSTNDQRASTRRCSLRRTPPRASVWAHESLSSDALPPIDSSTADKASYATMPLVLPFDTCSCEFYAFLFSIASAFYSCCAISSHKSLCRDSQHLDRPCDHSW